MATSPKCQLTSSKKGIFRKEKKERLLRKWNIKNDKLALSKTPQRVIWELIEKEKKEIKKKINRKLTKEMSKEGYSSFVLNNISKYKDYIVKVNDNIDYKKTLDNYLIIKC